MDIVIANIIESVGRPCSSVKRNSALISKRAGFGSYPEMRVVESKPFLAWWKAAVPIHETSKTNLGIRKHWPLKLK